VLDTSRAVSGTKYRKGSEHAGTIPNAYRTTHKYTSIQQHAMSLQPHARLMHHTTHSTADTRRIVSTMAPSLPFQVQRHERDLQ
jgi:hypothetical protein